MKVSELWLREWVSPSLSLAEIAAQLTQAGLEVEHIQGEDYANMVVGEVLAADPHPNADRLKLCQVSAGSDSYSIVCGAENVRRGLKVALALPGSVLPVGVKIKKAKIRGQLSEGMLCSSGELALEDKSDGILELSEDAKTGAPLAEYLPQVMDIAIMPNRGDCLSIRGIAREVGVLNKLPFKQPLIKSLKSQHREIIKVKLSHPQGCPLYFGRVIKGLDISRPTPLWMKEKLENSGMRSIDAVVDITNFVMLELGQPLHAFDLAVIDGAIEVRLAKSKEKLTLLDGTLVELDPSDLMIADKSKPLALAGVMGGVDSGIGEGTKDVFLEGAFFSPLAVQGKQRKFNFVTEAAHRFERGVDYKVTEMAMERATSLLVDILGGSPGPLNKTEVKDHLPNRKPLTVSQERLNSFLGFTIPSADIERILTQLGMKIKRLDEDRFTVLPPSFRFDMDCWEAVAEEVARIYGYDEVPTKLPIMPLQPRLPEAILTREDKIRHWLIARGYQEVISYSFISNKEYMTTSPVQQPLQLANPISEDMIAMRGNLLAGLLSVLSHNQRQSIGKQKLFEIGTCFVAKGKDYLEENHIAGIVEEGGGIFGELGDDFYSTKGDLEMLLSSLDTEQELSKTVAANAIEFLHPAQSLVWHRKSDKELVCYCGLVHPRMSQVFKLRGGKVYYFELKLDKFGNKLPAAYEHFSRYPSAQRQLSLVMDEAVSYSELEEFIFSYGGLQLQKLELLDIYRSAELGKQKKSLSLRLTWQSEKETLTDEEINRWVDRLLQELAKKMHILLREG